MCKYCKTCGKSNFGATRIRKITDAVRLVDGIVKEVFDNSEESMPEEFEINYCFECNKEITEKDLVSEIKCPVCGKMVDHLTDDGICDECKEEAAKLSSMSKEELVLMFLKQQKEENKDKKGTKSKRKTSTKTKNNSKTEEKDDIINEADKIVAERVELDSSKTKEKEEKAKPSKEPVEMKEEEIKDTQAKQEEAIKDAPSAESANAEKVQQVNEVEVSNEIETAIPDNNDAEVPVVDAEPVVVDNTAATIDEINDLLNSVDVDDYSATKTEKESANNYDDLF